MPVIPFITDTPQMIEKYFRDIRQAGLDFIIFSGMTLKDGRQKDHFFNTLRDKFPNLLEEYHRIYTSSKWGETSAEYYEYLQQVFSQFANKFKIPKRIPSFLFKDILDDNDRVVVILDQRDYLLKQQGSKSPYGYAAHSISKIKEPLADIRKNLRKLSGIGPLTERIIREILDTGSSAYYEKLM